MRIRRVDTLKPFQIMKCDDSPLHNNLCQTLGPEICGDEGRQEKKKKGG